jgi:protein SCO1/2
MNRFGWAAVIVALGLVLGSIVSGWIPEPDSSLILSEPPRGGDFTLDGPQGPFRLQDQRGKVVLVYFGYTFCPDICPTNLALITQALNAMTEEELHQVQGVFISVDPARDTLDRLATYTGYFHDAIVGITGTLDDIAPIAKQYGAAYRKIEGESQGGYLVDHSSNTYVIAPDGSLHTILPHGTPPQEILQVTRGLLAQHHASY